jgi:hypothetical protein
MKQIKLLLFIIACTNIFAACKKDKNTTDTVDQLPPATQIGANTFGCLVNGKVYIPKGSSGNGSPNPKKIYDIGLNGLPYMQINAGQYEQNNQIASFILGIDSLTSVGIHNVYTTRKQVGFGSTQFPNCGILADDNTQFKIGTITITKHELNPNSGIISGIFNFKIKINNCDTLFFTEGRFDFKL